MPEVKEKTTVSKLMKLQVNTAGAWKDVITLDGADDRVSNEVMDAAHSIGLRSNANVSFRIVATDPSIGVLAHWTHADGWKENRHAER